MADLDHQVFRFGAFGFAMGFSSEKVTLNLNAGAGSFSLSGMTPADARAIANALFEASDFAERALPVTVAAPTSAPEAS